MQLKIELKHLQALTTATDIFTTKNSVVVEAVEYSEKLIVFQLPKVKLTTGGLVSLSCNLHMDQVFDFTVTGKVLFCETPNATSITAETSKDEPALMRTGIELRQYDRDLWLRFLRAASEEQRRVDSLLSSMKGSSGG